MAVTQVVTGRITEAEYSNVKDTFPQSAATTGIATTDTLVAGTGYVTTSETGVATTSSGSGTGCTVDITTNGVGVTVVVINEPGTGYAIGDTQTIISGNSDATFDVLTLTDIVSTGTDLKVIDGAGTKFLTDVVAGDYIYFPTTDEIEEIESVQSDTRLYLKTAIASKAGVAFKFIKKYNCFRSVSILLTATAEEINTISMPLGTSKTYGNDKPIGAGGGRRITPILIDSTVNAGIVLASGE